MPVSDDAVPLERDGSQRLCSVTARPVSMPVAAEPLLLVAFREHPERLPKTQWRAHALSEARLLTKAAEDELEVTRDDLQTTIDELENSNEELKVLNEELESSKEELQSLNEELITVNGQLQEKVEDLDRVNSKLTNLLDSTEIATLFLDASLCISKFTSGIRDLFKLRAGDVGRPLSDLSTKNDDPTLLDDCSETLGSSRLMDREVLTPSKGWFLRRIFPAPSHDPQAGLVITYVDINEIKRARGALEQRELSARLIQNLPIGALYCAEGRVHMNQAAEELTGYRSDQVPTLDAWFTSLFGERHKDVREQYLAARGQEKCEPVVAEIRRADGESRTVEFRFNHYSSVETAVLSDLTEKQAVQRSILDAVAAQQQQIGQEMHDVILQELTGLALMVGSLGRRFEAMPNEAAIIHRLGIGLDGLSKQVRQLSEGLIPALDDSLTFQGALRLLLDKAAEGHKIDCELEYDAPGNLEPHVAHQLYRISQEAVTNAVRHSGARRILICVAGQRGKFMLEVLDDGVGMEGHQPRQGGQGGLGRQIMRYRCELVGGRFSSGPRPEGGSYVRCILHLRNNRTIR